MPLPPSDFTRRAIRGWRPRDSSSAWSALTSLSHTEPLVDIQ